MFDFHRQQALDAGCNDFLPKPIEAKELFLQLKNHLQLTWIYQSEYGLAAKKENTLVEVEMIIPESSELVALYEAAQRCDVADIQTETHRIKQLNLKYTVFANKILALADEFEVEAIANFIKAHIL